MKKIFLLALVFVASYVMFAQNTLVVNKKDGSKAEYLMQKIDTIYFVDRDSSCNALKDADTQLSFTFDEITQTATMVRYHCDYIRYLDTLVIPPFVCHDNVEFKVTSVVGDNPYDADSISHIVIPNTVTTIGDHAFQYFYNVSHVDIPNSVKTIGYQSFAFMGITSLFLPDSLESIDWYAFYGCSNLKRVEIPSSVKSIGVDPFYGCDKLDTVIMSRSIPSSKIPSRTTIIYRD